MALALAPDITSDELIELTDMVRLLMRDFAMNNILLEKAQFNDKEIHQALRLTTSMYNMLPPMTSVAWRDLPEALLLMGVTYWLMLSESFLQIRNQISVQTDGLGVVGLDDKYQLYATQAAQLKSDFQQQARDIKVSMNLESGYGSMSSGYANVSRFQH
jgi:hypothetical protein